MLRWKPGQWQDMFLTQPPVKHLLIFDRPNPWSRFVTLYEASGIRLGALVKCIRRWRHRSMEVDGAKQAWIEALYRDCRVKHDPLGIMYLPEKYWKD